MSGNSKPNLSIQTFKTLALMHIDSIYRLALYMTGNEYDTQKLVQNTYLKAYKCFRRFEAETICKAWLLGILNDTFVSSACDDNRSRQVTSLPESRSSITQLPDNTDDKVPRDGFGDEIIHAIDELPRQYGTVVLLADAEGLSCKEIADVIGCSEETVMSRLCRGRRMLGRKLQDKRFSPECPESMEKQTVNVKLRASAWERRDPDERA